MGTLGSLTSVGGWLDRVHRGGEREGGGRGVGRVCGRPSAFPVVSALPWALLSLPLLSKTLFCCLDPHVQRTEGKGYWCMLDYWRLLTSTSTPCTLLKKIGMQGNVITVTTSVVPAYNME